MAAAGAAAAAGAFDDDAPLELAGADGGVGADAGGATSSSSDDATSWTGADFLVGPEPPLLPDEFSLSAPGFEKPKAKSVAI